ncbi:MAG TPA: hypothetical protein VHW23_32570 [Kofleriaceae bacterium]|nr:hypothetical protein [Kofleriaceae bacterium]
MMFNRWDFHLKNPDPLPVLEPPMAFLHQVRMPLLMVIAGIATAIALERRTVAGFALDRIQRLFVPLVFGMLVIVPPQIYIEASERIALRGYPETHRLIGDWDTIAYYALLFASGHLLGRSPAVWDHLVARRWRYLAALGALLAVMLPPNEYPFPFGRGRGLPRC